MAAKHQHKFQRLSDTAIYCACGEIRHADPEAFCTRPHYPGWWSPWIYPNTNPVYWPTITTGGTTTVADVEIGSTVYDVTDGNVTYT